MLHMNNKKYIFALLFTIFSLLIYFPCYAKENKKSLVLYYSLIKNQPLENWDADTSCSRMIYDDSLTGLTEFVAKNIQSQIDADIGYIISSKNYSSSYQNVLSQTQEEKQKNIKPPILTTIDATTYDVIYLGFPVWWYSIPMAVISFLENNELKDKTIYLFCTSKETDATNFTKEIQLLIPDCKVLSPILQIKTDELIFADKIISDWLKKIN